MKRMSTRAVKNLCLPTIGTQHKIHYKTYITPRSKKEKRMFWYTDYFVQSPDNMAKIIEMMHERERFKGLREYVRKIMAVQGQEDFRLRFIIDAPSDNDYFLAMLYINYHLAQGYYTGIDYSISYQLHKNWETNLSHFKGKDLKKDEPETQGDVAVAKPATKENGGSKKRKNEDEPSWYGVNPTYLLAGEHDYSKLLADEKLLNKFPVIYALSSRAQYSMCSPELSGLDSEDDFGFGFMPMHSTPEVPPERSLLNMGFKLIYIPESGVDELKLILNKIIAGMNLTLAKSVKFDVLRSEHGQYLNTEHDVLTVIKLIKEHKILNKSLGKHITYSDFIEVLDAQSEQRKKYAPATQKRGKKKDNPWDELNGLIGCEHIKREVRKMVDSMKLDKRRRMLGLPGSQMTKHSLFYGNPGSCKTTCGKIIARILQHEGIIKSDAFKLCVKSDIVGQYVGWTAAAVDGIFREMSANGGGVLFLDEAYTYTQDQTCFDREAINCLVQGLEEHRDVMAIFAGYKDLMIQFTENNPGLKSRIGFVFEFSDYNADEMYQITKYQAKQLGYTLPDNCEGKLTEYFTKLRQLQGESFGNGREARKLVEGAVLELAARLATKKRPSKAEVTVLTNEDIEAAIKNSLEREKAFEQKSARPIGFLRS